MDYCYSKSPKSVATCCFTPVDISGTEFPKLPDGKAKYNKNNNGMINNHDSVRHLRRMSGIVSIWQQYALQQRNEQQKQRRRRHRTTTTTSSSSSSSSSTSSKQREGKIVQWKLSKNETKEFDQDACVLCLSRPSMTVTKEDDMEDALQLRWYEQDYQELQWWEYPDLDEEDEITAMVRNCCSQRPQQKLELRYVEHVEGIVWTAALRLLNLAQFVAHKTSNNNKSSTTSKNATPSTRGQPHPPPKRATVPAIFEGLPKEVQAEKRRFQKSHRARSSNSADNNNNNDEDDENNGQIESRNVDSKKQETSATAATATAEPVKKRNVIRHKPSVVDYETPAAWTRSTTTRAVQFPTCIVTAPPKVMKAPSRTAATATKTKIKSIVAPDPVVRPPPTTATATASSTTSSSSAKSRIQALKLKHAKVKAEQERQELENAEKLAVQQRWEQQRKRLERLRQKQQM